ncbi:MAG: hypothetical protein EPN86_02175 [Nanoarchaeota archaeon]|nr:MAG: hypothetical protein EPN86_02175 [Nanoarchaeota archaeon]
MRAIPALFLSIAVFTTAGWMYVIGVQFFLPNSILTSPLSHWSKWPRVDDFGMFCFIVSFLSFFAFLLTNTEDGKLKLF